MIVLFFSLRKRETPKGIETKGDYMSYLYINEQGANLSFEDNRFIVKYKNDMQKSIPAEIMEEISVFGAVQITSKCMQECLRRGINIIFYSKNGSYFGRLISPEHVNTQRQRAQAKLYENEKFRLEFSKKIIDAKIKNQLVIIRRYERNAHSPVNLRNAETEMKYMLEKIRSASTLSQVMGYEGTAAKAYFKILGELVDKDFKFSGRSRRPPKDSFNSMLSLGYSILLNEIYGKLEARGLNPYFGFMHTDREKHPALASDLMEEWRAVLVDSTVMSLVNGHEVHKDGFYSDGEDGVFLDKKTFTVFVNKLENKFRTDNKYIPYIDYSVSFRRAIDLQVYRLAGAIEAGDADEYMPVIIR